ncbi:MAG: DNA-binding protein WhiA [Actinobacteria bacterium HGW-Actinobacteria-9]|nr:MAG: DNA-binding protein WhiA [Actinobacteria bacterium HGW-Actinobacteria-9]
MSFTAEVKEELSRIEARRPCCLKAELAALVRIEGTLHITGREQFRLEVATETAPVARKAIKLLHGLYSLKTELTVRRSVLHKTNNYLITVPSQPDLPAALTDMGILDDSSRLAPGILPRMVKRDCCAVSYLRGAFLGGGFVADPHGDFHFELTAESEQMAEDLAGLMGRFEVPARVTRRRGLYTVYLKGAEPIVTFLALVGAHRALLRTEDVRVIKSMRNDVNRLVNAETANLERSAEASLGQIEAILLLQSSIGLDNLPPALQELARLRLENPETSLRELGELADPPLSKSAVYHRVRRIEEMAAETGTASGKHKRMKG